MVGGASLLRPRVLLVEDHPDLGPSIQRGLIQKGFEVELVTTLHGALHRISRAPRPQMVVLDLSLPDADGLEAVRALRAVPLPDPPILLVLTVYRDLDLRVRALEAGADDFMVKPFAMEELAARLHALSRRGRSDRRAPLTFGPLLLDPVHRMVRLEGRMVELTPGEFTILWRLALAGGGPIRAGDLGEPRAGDPIEFSEGAVRVLIHRIRRKLHQAFGGRVEIRWHRVEGYRLEVRE